MKTKMSFEKLEKLLNYHFRCKKMIQQALIHKSYGHEHLKKAPIHLRDNERLEFLGDAILASVVSSLLLKTFPEANEGLLSKMRSAVVNEKSLAKIADSLQLSHYVQLGRGESQTQGNRKASILSSTFEALVAAIYLDGNYDQVFKVIEFIFTPLFFEVKSFLNQWNYKSQLQEMIQSQFKISPSYHLVGTDGQDHEKKFQVEVKVYQHTLGSAQGRTKKEAEQKAAKAALSVFEDWKNQDAIRLHRFDR